MKEVIEGYTNQLSYQAGDRMRLHVSSSAASFSVEIARIGAQRDVVWLQDALPGMQYPTPGNASSHGCGWPAAIELEVPHEWRSGYYSVLARGKGTNGRTLTGEMFFVVRPAEPAREARILVVLSTNTYNAYNNWGGTCLYRVGSPQGTRVSFDRPYSGFDRRNRLTRRSAGWANWEQPFLRWAEEAGYQIDFAVNSDLEFRPEIVKPYRLLLTVGHDEYWSWPMRDTIEAFIANGGNVAFFSGNVAFWQVRFEDAGRAMVSWKQNFDKDPVYQQDDKHLLTGTWTNLLVNRPENRMTGVSFAYGGYHNFFEIKGDGGYTVHRPDHWIFAGTNLKRGDLLGGQEKIVGYECDGCCMEWINALPVPTHADQTPENFEILATAPAGLSTKGDRSLFWVSEGLYGKKTRRRARQDGAAVVGCYARGGTVVTTGCTEWANGLRLKNRQVEQITRNILDRLSR
jgi:hypothetical protein